MITLKEFFEEIEFGLPECEEFSLFVNKEKLFTSQNKNFFELTVQIFSYLKNEKTKNIILNFLFQSGIERETDLFLPDERSEFDIIFRWDISSQLSNPDYESFVNKQLLEFRKWKGLECIE